MRKPVQLLTEAFDITHRNVSQFMWILLVPVILTFIASLLGPTPVEESLRIGYTPAYIFMSIVSGVVNMFMTIAIILAIQNNGLKAIDAYKQSAPFFFRYLGMSILMSMILFVGFLLLIVPGVIMSIWFAFSSFVLVLEREGVVESLKKSREYVRGRWLPVFGRVVFLAVVAIVVAMFISVISVIFPTGTFGVALASALSMLLAPIAMVYMYLVYQDLKGNT